MKKRARRTRDSIEQRLQRWTRRHYTLQRIAEAQALSLRRDLITLLTYVRDHKVTGTQSTGNMPLKAIREVTAQFVNPPVLDRTSGDRVYELRTEDDVWSLQFLHILASVGDLLVAEPGRRWRLTPNAAKFLDADPVIQLALLLAVWWFQVNWLVAYPVGGIGEFLPDSFAQVTLDRLRAIRTGSVVSFDEFADALIETSGLTWTAPNMSYARMSLRSAIERTVIRILENFGAVHCTHRDHATWPDFKVLDTFEITPLGAVLLDWLSMQRSRP